MSKPYCIWTTQRTGGTTFSKILGVLTEYPVIQDEPFKKNRVFGPIMIDYFSRFGADVYQEYYPFLFSKKPVFKHCYQYKSDHPKGDFDKDLFLFLEQEGYSHIHLFRENRIEEYLSYVLAFNTGVWSSETTELYDGSDSFTVNLKKLGIHITTQERKKKNMKKILMESASYLEVSYEDLYLNKKLAVVSEVADFLGISEQTVLKEKTVIEGIYSETNQKSENHYSLIKNLGQVKKMIGNTTARIWNEEHS